MQVLPFTSGEIIMAVAALVSTALNWRFAASVSGLKLEIKSDIKNEIDSLRREFSSGFMSAPLALEQRSSTIHRIENLEREMGNNRTRLHDISGDIMSGLTAQIYKMNDQLTDKARRMSAWETRQEVQEGMIHEHSNQIQDLGRRMHDIEHRHYQIDHK